MVVPLNFNIEEEEDLEGVPLGIGLNVSARTTALPEGLPLDFDLGVREDKKTEGLPLDFDMPTPIMSPRAAPDKPFAARHPNLYAIGGAAKETAKTLIPYLKYIDPEEREKFMELSQQKQTRELLLQNLEAVSLLAFEPLAKGLKPVVSETMKKYLPKTYKFLTKPIGKGGAETIAKAIPEAKLKKEIPTETELPKYAGSVNLERQAIPKEMKLTELRAAEEVPKTKISWGVTDKASNEILNDSTKLTKVFEKVKQGTALNTAESDAIRKANVEGLFKFQDRINKATTPEEVLSITDAYRTELFEPVTTAASEAGRTLNIYNREIGLNRIGKAFGKLKRGLNKRELEEFKALDLNDPVKTKLFVERLGNPKLKDYVYEYWYNQILSGIPTHVVNVASNTGFMAFQIPHRAITAGVDKLVTTFTGKARTRFLNEIVPMMGGMKTGAKRGAVSAKELVQHGKIQEFETKWAQEIGSALGAFNRSPSKVVREVGKYLTVPTKALRGMDVFANSIAYDAQLNALARRASNLKGLKGTTRKTFETDFATKPSKAAHKEAMEFAKYTTFMSDPGKISTSILKLRESVAGGRLVVPFVNTIGNLLKRGVEMTPAVGLTLAKGQPPAEVIAKQLEGSVISFFMLLKAHKGEITGAVPTNKAEREAFYRQGKKPWAIKIGGQYYSYRRVEPFNTILATTAIVYDKLTTAKDEETATEMFLDMANEFKNNLIDSSYLQGVTRILNRHGAARGAVQRMGVSFVPYSGFLRSITRAAEVITEGSTKVRDTKSVLGALSQTIPGLADFAEVPARVNVWGKEIELEGGVFRQWLPYKWSTATADPTELALEKLEVYPALPRNTYTHKGVEEEFDEEIFKDLCLSYGSEAKEILDKNFTENKYWTRALKGDEKQLNRLRDNIDSLLTRLRNRERGRAIYRQIRLNRQGIR